MRPLRLLLSLLSCIVAITLLLYVAIPSSPADVSSTPLASHNKGRLRALFSFSAPSLFPPSAIISLTDDNSTFFLARPAAFGPLLPTKGLSGQLWTGSGFGGDSLSHGGLATGAEGELGCSDVPGWDEGRGKPGRLPQLDASKKSPKAVHGSPEAGSDVGRFRRGPLARDAGASSAAKAESEALHDDGTDDHLDGTVSDPWLSKSKAHRPGNKGSDDTEHADIQSLQESAEIAGKVVLLSRGGCGFLEKVKWAQRRGGVAVIVGDDIRGGPLVTMYARGDTSNITIPALFTSHTTAHLLSSLVPSGGILDNLPSEDSLKLGLGKNKTPNGSQKHSANGPTFTSSLTPKQTSLRRTSTKSSKSSSSNADDLHVDVAKRERVGWIRSLLAMFSSSSNQEAAAGESRRPPSSGNIDWILVQDWEDDEPGKSNSKTTKGPNTSAGAKKTKPTPSKLSSAKADDFVIGVQDWRDPDLLPQQTDPSAHNGPKDKLPGKQSSGDSTPQGGSILPGSGEYSEPQNGKARSPSAGNDPVAKDEEHGGNGWLGGLPWNKESDSKSKPESKPSPVTLVKPNASNKSKSFPASQQGAVQSPPVWPNSDQNRPHDGLWVTLTPTSMSNSPFFDTLLVLVVSPLVTLTVVYALLLLRSRIRRRRWRAPKSVVERLPVRTYHTLNSGDSTASNSPIATPAAGSPRTPLLQQSSSSAHASASRSRPRSRTAGEIPASSFGTVRERSASPDDEEKGETGGLAAWRRKYGGRQKECVVCLEEYVDGVSRVMSLPCGHEFHAECITPWLTTRRRTCPICKGDVVRSLASQSSRPHASSPSTFSSPLSPQSPSSFRASTRPLLGSRTQSEDDGEEDSFQAQAAHTRNDSPSANRPLSVSSMGSIEEEDLERGRGREDESGVVAWARDGWNDVQTWAGSWWSDRRGRGRRAERFDEGFDRDR